MSLHQDLMRHLVWADEEVWRAVLALPAAADDPATRDRLHHIHEVQWVYLQLWRGEPVAPRALGTFTGAADIRDWGREFHREVAGVIEQVETQDRLTRELRVPWADQLVKTFGAARPGTVSESVLQVSLHSTYHRGQVNARLRELGGEPPLVDFIVWIWRGRPSPA